MSISTRDRVARAAGGFVPIRIGEEGITVCEVPRCVLSSSPILDEWVRDPETIPPSLLKDGCIYLRAWDEQVLRFILHHLGTTVDGKWSRWGKCTLTGQETAPSLLKMYKASISIKVDDASSEAMRRLRARNMGVEEFVEGILIAGRLDIVEDNSVASWIASWLAANMERIRSSTDAERWLRSGSADTWLFTTTIMASLAKIHDLTKSNTGTVCTTTSNPNVKPLKEAGSGLSKYQARVEDADEE